jgi:hypothetical protein
MKSIPLLCPFGCLVFLWYLRSELILKILISENCERTNAADVTVRFELTGWEKVCPVLGCFGQILIAPLQFTHLLLSYKYSVGSL